MKHLQVRQKYHAARRIFNSLLSVSSGDETLRLMCDILHETRAVKLLIPKIQIQTDGIVSSVVYSPHVRESGIWDTGLGNPGSWA